MLKILLLCLMMSMSCQRLRLEVDDLRLRCGDDASLVDVAQWIEPFSDFGKPSATSIRAAVVDKDLQLEKLPVSSKGCIALPAGKIGWEWLAIRSEEGGVFGKVLKPSRELYRRVQMDPLGGVSPRFDCPVPSAVNQLPLKVTFPEQKTREHFLLNMELSDSKEPSGKNLQLDTNQETGDQFFFNIEQIQEGSYQAKISLVDLLNIQNNLKGFERICSLRVDRTPPRVKLILRKGSDGSKLETVRLGPGEAVEIKAEDAAPTRIFSCWTEKSAGTCQNFVEAGLRLSAPDEGDWLLEYYAMDDAGNASGKMKHEVTIFDADRVGRIVGWIDEARLYLKQESYFDAAKRMYQVAWTMAGLKTQTERKYIQDKFRMPFLSLLIKNVPVNRFRNDDGKVLDLWGVSPSTFLAHVDGERRLGRIIRLHDLSGKVIKKLSFEDQAIVNFSWHNKKLLVWRPDGMLQVYDTKLSLESSFSLPWQGKAQVLSYKGNHVLVQHDEGIFHVDLTLPHARLLDKVRDRNPAAALNLTGKWLVYQTTDGLVVQDLEEQTNNSKSFPLPIDEIRFATFVDTMCIKFSTEIKCGEPKKILENEYLLEGEDALGAFALDPYARIIGYVGSKKVYQFNADDGTFFYKPYLKSVFSLYFVKQLLMLESTDGALSWIGLPNEAGEPKPFDPGLRPKIPENWTDNEQIFYEDVIGHGLYSLILRAFGQAPLHFGFRFNGKVFDLQKMAVLPDQAHLVVLDRESHINIYSTGKSLFQAYAVDCLALAPQGNRCVFAKDGKMQYGEFHAGKTSSFAKTGDLPGVSPYASASWSPFSQDKVALFSGNNVSVFAWEGGKARLIFENQYSKGTWQVKWLSPRYLAISDGYTEIEVWDIERNKRIFVLTDHFGVESMFHIPMDYSPILDSFVIIGTDSDNFPIMEAWKPGTSEAQDHYKFTDKDMEYAQIVKFMADGKLVMVGFHHGYVYVVKDFSQKLKAGNVIAMKDDQDIIADLGFLQNGKLAYTISEDGSITTHKLEGDYSSEEIVKSDYLTAGGWLENDQAFWAQYNDNTTVFYDINGRVLDRGDVALNFTGEMVFVNAVGKALFNWNSFDVWQALCRWSPHLVRKAMDDLEMEWKTCDER